ncbi:PepSY-like domain-containing protein [Deminuibacter soli]|nr:PepSY-like domain-containing protein [Deminuibacter soli]
MKRIAIWLLMAFSFTAFAAQAQIRKVPAEVTDAFKQKFPNASGVSWKDKLTDWQAKFKDGSTSSYAWFTNKGEWKETDQELTYESLPEAVKDGFKKSKYNEWTPKETASIIKKDQALQYRVYVEKHSLVQKKYLFFDEHGALKRDVQSL